MRSIIVDLAGLSLIACFGTLMIAFPQKMYDLFIFGLGRDNHRKWSPEHGRGYRLAVQAQGTIMLLVALAFMLLLVKTK